MEHSPRPDDNEYYGNFDSSSSVFGYIVLGVKCTIVVWIILINIIFVTAIKSSSHVKKKSLHWFLINLAVADLMVGLLVAPFSIGVMGYWQLGDFGCHVWILADVLLCCVSLFALLAINIDRLVFVMKPLTYTMVMRKTICAIIIVFSWLLASAVMFSVLFTEQVHSKDWQCYISLAPVYAIGSSIVSFFLPALLVINANVCIVIIVTRKTRTKRKARIYLEKSPEDGPALAANSRLVMATMVEARERASRDSNQKLKRSALMMCIANSFYLLMWFPFFLLNILIAFGLYKDISVFSLEFCVWLGYANSGLNPLLWMIYPDIRKAFKECCCCCCRGRSRARSVPDDKTSYTKNTIYTNTM